MEMCPEALMKLCAATANYQFNSTQIVSFLFGVLVVITFAVDRYKIPTYAKTTIGEFIELAPESLTSRSRYQKGQYTYCGLMLLLYSILVILGPATLAPVLGFFSVTIDTKGDSAIWP